MQGQPERQVPQLLVRAPLCRFWPHYEHFGAEAWLLDPEDDRLMLLMLPCGSSKTDQTPPSVDPLVWPHKVGQLLDKPGQIAIKNEFIVCSKYGMSEKIYITDAD